MMKYTTRFVTAVLSVAFAVILLAGNSNCGVYKFTESGTIPPAIKTIKVDFIENRAQYVNPQLSPKLTDKLRQKIVSQTKLTQTNNGTPDWEISGFIREYTFSTAAISGQQASNNRLTVTVHIVKTDNKENQSGEYDVSRSFEFKGNKTFQQAESELAEEMIRTLTDEIFNKLFSNW
jgi:hypothetical protein